MLLAEWPQVVLGACLPSTLAQGFCSWVGKVATIFPVNEAGDRDRSGAEPLAGRRHLGPACWDPSIAYCLFHVLPGLQKAFLHSVEQSVQ